MSSIEKVAVYDPRIVQDAPAYAVQKGALSVTTQPFAAVSATNSQHTYQVLVPSLNVFVDKKVMWQSTVYVSMDCYWAGPTDAVNAGAVGTYNRATCLAPPTPGGYPGAASQSTRQFYPIRYGHDFTLPMFPLQSMCSNMTASINDCVVTTNGDTLREQILLTNTKENRKQRTTPSQFDKYAWGLDDLQSTNGMFSSYAEAGTNEDIPNGAWKIEYLDQAGVPINPSNPAFPTGIQTIDYGLGATYNKTTFVNGQPCWITDSTNTSINTLAALPMRLCFRFTVTEPLVMTPFSWQDSLEMSSTGLYGCTNMAFTMNLQQSPSSNSVATKTVTPTAYAQALYYDNLVTQYNPVGNLIRATGQSTLFSNVTLSRPVSSTGGVSSSAAFDNSQLLVTFLTPGVDVDLPLVSSVPYYDFPRYFTSVGAGTTGVNMQSQTVTLSSIPDYLMIYVKPRVRGQTQGETYAPITNIGVTFDNFSNLCSNFSQQNLYNSSVACGLDMDYLQWSGAANSSPYYGSLTVPFNSALVSPNTPTLIQGLTPATSVTFSAYSEAVSGGTYYNSTPGTYPGTMQYASKASLTQLTGGPLILRMGEDISLSPGLAPGCLGNYSVQVNISIDTATGFMTPYVSNGSGSAGAGANAGFVITILAVNSGLFETVRGQSAIRKTILNATDVEAARASSGVTRTSLHRLVGGAHHVRHSTSQGLQHYVKHHGSGKHRGHSMSGLEMGKRTRVM